MAVEASGTYVRTNLRVKMEDLEDEMKAERIVQKAAEDKLEELEEESDIMSTRKKDFLDNLVSSPEPGESPDEFDSRTLDVNNSLIDDVDSFTDVEQMLPIQIIKG